MRILWLTWKDAKHPLAGGAEVVSSEIAKRLVASGHEVTFLTAQYPDSLDEAQRDGYKIIRTGGRLTVYWKAYRYFKKNLSQWPDVVIDEMNTIPFFASFYTDKPTFLFVHQLARQVWFYQMPFPISVVGYWLEPIYLWMLRKSKVIAVSESTRKDLSSFFFNLSSVFVISEGIQIKPIESIDSVTKYPEPTVLSLGAVRPMKRTDHIVKAFEILKARMPEAQLIIAGDTSGAFGKKVTDLVMNSPFKDSIQLLGSVTSEKKIELMQRSHVLAVTSVKEGWGLVVTEAASQGTPAVVYDVDGLRDSVRNGETGLVVSKTPEALALGLHTILQPGAAHPLATNALAWSKNITFEKAAEDFKKVISSAR